MSIIPPIECRALPGVGPPEQSRGQTKHQLLLLTVVNDRCAGNDCQADECQQGKVREVDRACSFLGGSEFIARTPEEAARGYGMNSCARVDRRNDVVRHSWLIPALLIFPTVPTSAQTFQFLPEVDTYFKVNSNVTVYFQAKQTREGGDPTQAELGPSIEFYLKPLIKLKHVTAFDLDDTKKRLLVLDVGYRYLPSPSSPPENRLRLDLTSHFPLRGGILISDRNRADLDWQSGKFTWRYRNRLTVERWLAIKSYHAGPYVSVEPFYESQYQKWSTTALYAGCLFPIGKHVQFDPYYEHQNNTGKKPNQQLNQFGLILNLYF